MANIFKKHKNNLKGGNLLQQKKIYDAAIHCFYYSSFLLSKHVLCTYYNVPYDDQNIQSNGGGSHDYIINYLYSEINKDKNSIIARVYFKNITKLKAQRKRADYSDELLLKEDSLNSELVARAINKLIYDSYEIQD